MIPVCFSISVCVMGAFDIGTASFTQKNLYKKWLILRRKDCIFAFSYAENREHRLESKAKY